MKGLLIQEETPTPDSPSEIKWGLVDENADNYITKLEQEIERLSTENKKYKDLGFEHLQKENNILNNIINELEKWLIENKENTNDEYYGDDILDKLKELKGSDKE